MELAATQAVRPGSMILMQYMFYIYKFADQSLIELRKDFQARIFVVNLVHESSRIQEYAADYDLFL